MAMVGVGNPMGLYLENGLPATTFTNVNNTIDAVGESAGVIGRVILEGGSAGGSKTISAAGGGKIIFRTATVTNNNAGTTIRVGIQDIAANGLEDGTYDVYGDFTGASQLTANTWYEKAMTSGTKTISHEQEIAIIIEMIARGGTDSIQVPGFVANYFWSSSSNYPYRTVDTGSGPTRQSAASRIAAIIFDDGTLGWIEMAATYPNMDVTASISFNDGSSPDEYAVVFKLPYKARLRASSFFISGMASTDEFQCHIYSDPEGTPFVERTYTGDPDKTGNAAGVGAYWVNWDPFILQANTWYAISLRPTTSGALSIQYNNVGSTFGSKYKKMLALGADQKFSGRTNQSGPFVEVSANQYPIVAMLFDQLDDGAGGSSAEPAGSHP